MGKKGKQMTWDRFKVKHHCADERCMHPIHKMPQCLMCRKFKELVRQGKNPTMCPYYNHIPDYSK